MNNLDTLSKRILQMTDLTANREITDIAQELRIPLHKVQYALRRLVDLGVVRGRLAFINHSNLGLTSFVALLSTVSFDDKIKKQLSTAIAKQDAIPWASEVLGDAQLALQFYGTDLYDMRSSLASIEQRAQLNVLRRRTAIRLTHAAITRTYIDEAPKNRRELFAVAHRDSCKAQLDELDLKILQHIAVPSFDSINDVAKKIGSPQPTVHRRVKSMEAQGIIAGYQWNLNLEALGRKRYRVILQSISWDEATIARFINNVRLSAWTTNYAICLGDWDFELSLELPAHLHVHSIIGEILKGFEQGIRGVSVVENVRYLKYQAAAVLK